MPWIKLTEPSGQPIHINVEQVCCVRPDTQVPGANAQLDLVSGKIQGVKEDVGNIVEAIKAARQPLVS